MTLPYNSIEQLRARVFELCPHLLKYDFIESSVFGKVATRGGDSCAVENTPFVDLLDNYYMTDSISRNSVTMAKCSTAFNGVRFNNFQKLNQHF